MASFYDIDIYWASNLSIAATLAKLADHEQFFRGPFLRCMLAHHDGALIRTVRSLGVAITERITPRADGYQYEILQLCWWRFSIPFVHEHGDVNVAANGVKSVLHWRTRFLLKPSWLQAIAGPMIRIMLGALLKRSLGANLESR
jgi:hypothetical protein